MKKISMTIFSIMISLLLTQCSGTSSSSTTPATIIPPTTLNTNIGMALATAIDRSTGAFLTSGSLTLNSGTQHFTGTRTLSSGIYSWSFTVSNLVGYSYTYYNDQDVPVTVSVNGSFTLSSERNTVSNTTKYSLSAPSSLTVTYGGTVYTITAMTYSHTIFPNTTVSILGTITVNGGTLENLSFAGINNN